MTISPENKESVTAPLAEVEYLIRSSVTDVTKSSDLQGAWTIYNAKCLSAMNQFDKYPDEYVDTLIALTKDTDKRVVLFSIMYIGTAASGMDTDEKKCSIDAVNAANKKFNDHTLNVAQGLSLGMLGYWDGAKWAADEMERTKKPDYEEFVKGVEYTLIKEVMEGWGQ
jgi:hypothetical protein